MSERFRDILDGLCLLCYRKSSQSHLTPDENHQHTLTCDVFVIVGELSPTIGEQQKREQILASLERFIRKEYNGVYTDFPELTVALWCLMVSFTDL